MGDRDIGEPTIELIEIESLFHRTLMDSKFVRKSVSEMLILRREFHGYSLEPRALLQIHILVAVDVLAS